MRLQGFLSFSQTVRQPSDRLGGTHLAQLPQKTRNRGRPRTFIEAIKQVSVDVHGDTNLRVSETARDHFGMCSLLNEDGSMAVPQVVESDIWQTGRPKGRLPVAASEVRPSDRMPLRRSEDDVI